MKAGKAQTRTHDNADRVSPGRDESGGIALSPPRCGIDFVDRASPPVVQRQILDPAYEQDVFDISQGKREAELADLGRGRIGARDPRAAGLSAFLTGGAVKGNRSYPAPLTARPPLTPTLPEATPPKAEGVGDKPLAIEPKPEPVTPEIEKPQADVTEVTKKKKRRKKKPGGQAESGTPGQQPGMTPPVVSTTTKAVATAKPVGKSKSTPEPKAAASVDTSKMSVDEIMKAFDLDKPAPVKGKRKVEPQPKAEPKPKPLTKEQLAKLQKEQEREAERRVEREAEKAKEAEARKNLVAALGPMKVKLVQKAINVRAKGVDYEPMAVLVDEGVAELEDAILRNDKLSVLELSTLSMRMVKLGLQADAYEPPLTPDEKDNRQADHVEEFFNNSRADETTWVHAMGGSKRGPSYADTVRKGVHAKIVSRLANKTYSMPTWRPSFEAPVPGAAGTLRCLITDPKFKGRDAPREFNITLRDNLGTQVSTRLNLHINIYKDG